MGQRFTLAGPALALAAVVAMVGCTGGEEPGGAGGAGEPVGGAASAAGDPSSDMVLAFDQPDSDDVNLLLSSEDDLRGLAPLEVLDVADDDPQRLILAFEMGSHHCHGVHLDTVETEARVSLQLQFGLRPGVAAASCGFGVYPYTVAADLAAPLGDRQLVLTGTSGTVGPTTDTDGAGGVDGPGGAGSADGPGGAGSADGPGGAGSADGADGAGAGAGDGDGAVGRTGIVDPDPPIWFNPSATESDEVGRYLGRHVEEAVEWAEFHGRAWRILTYDGIPVDPGGPEDPERVSFVVEGDVIVSYDWS